MEVHTIQIFPQHTKKIQETFVLVREWWRLEGLLLRRLGTLNTMFNAPIGFSLPVVVWPRQVQKNTPGNRLLYR